MGHAGLQIIKNQGQRQLHVTMRSEVKQASHLNTKTIQLQRMICANNMNLGWGHVDEVSIGHGAFHANQPRMFPPLDSFF